MGTRYRLDKFRSQFTIKVRASGLLASLGHNPTIAAGDFWGFLTFDADRPEQSSFEMTVRADSLEVTDDVKQKDKREMEATMRDEVLDVGKHSEIRFTSTGISSSPVGEDTFQLRISGELALHGVKRQECISAQARFRDNGVQLTGKFALRQSDFKIKRVKALAGALKVKDELELAFDIQGLQE